ncbi:MAG: ATP-binding protein [Lewinella sp.]
MTRFLFVFTGLLLFGSLQLTGQINTDSLLKISASLPDDKAKARFLEDNVVGHHYKSFDDPVSIFMEQLNIAKRTHNLQQELLLSLHVISAANFMGYFGLADSLSLHYVSRVGEAELAQTQVELYHEAAKASFYAQQYDQSIAFDSSMLELLPSIDDQSIQDSFAVESFNYLGKSYNASGRFIPAVKALNEGIDLLRVKDPAADKLREFYTELGIVYSQIGLYDRAVEYLNRTLIINPSPISIVTNQINIGRNLLLTKNYTEATYRYRKTLDIDLPQGRKANFLPFAYQGLIESYYRRGNIDSLDYYFTAFSALQAENTSQQNAGNFLYRQAQLFHDLAHNRLTAAEATGKALLDGAIDKNDPAEQLMYTELLSELYRKRGDYKQADYFTQNLFNLKDSIQGANRNNALLLYYNQFETKEKENQILLLDQEREREAASRKQFQTAAGLLGLLLLTGGLFYLQLRKARQKLKVQNQQLNELNATKDRFFGIIAHDLRNPIVALETADSQIEKLLKKGNTNGVKRTVGMISQTTGQLTNLLDNLLQWALGQSGAITLNKEPMLLAKSVQANMELYASAAENKSISLSNEVPENITVTADHNALQTILRNLMGNAVKFSPSFQDSNITIAHQKAGDMDIISVSDEGPGIPETELKGLFHLHQGTQQDGKRKSGTGLGLILCKEMAALHGGRIEVETAVGVGTTFKVYLPS